MTEEKFNKLKDLGIKIVTCPKCNRNNYLDECSQGYRLRVCDHCGTMEDINLFSDYEEYDHIKEMQIYLANTQETEDFKVVSYNREFYRVIMKFDEDEYLLLRISDNKVTCLNIQYFNEANESAQVAFKNKIKTLEDYEKSGLFNNYQMEEIRLAFENGLTFEKVAVFAKKEFYWMQMCQIRLAFEKGLTFEQVALLINKF